MSLKRKMILSLVVGIVLLTISIAWPKSNYLSGYKPREPQGSVTTSTPVSPTPASKPHWVAAKGEVAFPPQGIPILYYHSIANLPGNELGVPPAQFDAQMQYLHTQGYTTISLDQLYAALTKGAKVPRKPILLTFDDGYPDNYSVALSILERYGYTATFFVVTSYMQPRQGMLTWPELSAMSDYGMTIGSHTVHHLNLSKLPLAQQSAELSQSKAEIQRHLGFATPYFCYPYGGYDPATLQMLRKTGYKLAVTTDSGVVEPGDNVLRLKRIYVNGLKNLAAFKAKLAQLTQQAQRLQEMYQQGYAAFFQHKYADAIGLENAVLAQDSGSAQAYNVKGIAQCYAGQFSAGMANIDKALAINPDYGYARFNKALAYELYGQYANALNWYNRDLQIENYVWSYYGIAAIYGRKADVANTVKYLKLAINLDPEVKQVARTEADFAPVHNSSLFQALLQ